MSYTVEYVPADSTFPRDRLHITGPKTDAWIAVTCSCHGPSKNQSLWPVSTIQSPHIQNDLNSVWKIIDAAELNQDLGNVWGEEPQIILPESVARKLAASPEYLDYIQGSPDAVAALSDDRNQNREYKLCPFLYGFRLTVVPDKQ